MKVMVLGADGYLGWPLSMKLANKYDYEVIGVDNFSRRERVREIGSDSALPIRSMDERIRAFEENFGKKIIFEEGDLRDYEFVEKIIKKYRPDVIVHFAEIPSAPYSMIDVHHAVETHENNVNGTLNLLFAMKEFSPEAHLIKLGTMGEYGTPNIDIPEGFFEIEYRGRKDVLPFPRQAGSFYHQTKVHDSNNIMLACKIWGLRSTDIMQGVVYGTRTDETAVDERLVTRFDFDEAFGTVINRFCAQAVIGHPLTPYGKGNQTRGFLNIMDTMRCIETIMRNPPKEGEYRVVNQLTEVLNINEIAEKVQNIGKELGLDPVIERIENPRVEAEEHYYNVDYKKLGEMGFRRKYTVDDSIRYMLEDLIPHKERIEKYKRHIIPKIKWREGLSE
ncbi:MAG: NAD-dependent dehydratase [Candidatus Aenigmatarchaeota archaeon]|nr:MAG: NAD-dependent dehydratase [Candidatus Aenigmarchaeota archaeon]